MKYLTIHSLEDGYKFVYEVNEDSKTAKRKAFKSYRYYDSYENSCYLGFTILQLNEEEEKKDFYEIDELFQNNFTNWCENGKVKAILDVENEQYFDGANWKEVNL